MRTRVLGPLVASLILAACNERQQQEQPHASESLPVLLVQATTQTQSATQIGREVSVAHHLADGDEFTTPIPQLVQHGKLLFTAAWTIQEGGGRPLTKGTGAPLTDPTMPLLFPRNTNRLSGPEANSCAGCHNSPFGVPGGGGDVVANVFVLGQRFDFLTFDAADRVITRGTLDERGLAVTQQSAANSRATLGMVGSGYIELLAREMTADLQTLRDALLPGLSVPLVTKGVSFGVLSRGLDGSWNTSAVTGLSPLSTSSMGPSDPPSLIIRPFHQSGRIASIREFTNNAYNHHHGIQSEERFGVGADPDGDGFVNELTRADVTASTIFQATMAVPGMVIPNDPTVEAAITLGYARFHTIGCDSCHRYSLPLLSSTFVEPNPYNPPGNLRPGDAPNLSVDLSAVYLPSPRLAAVAGVTNVPAFTDLKLHDITTGPGDPNAEPLDMAQPAGSAAFFAGNRRFLTRKLWGTANEPPYFHHGKFTTLRQAVLAHAGEAAASEAAFGALTGPEQDAVIEFLKSLQVLPAGATSTIVDENYNPKPWTPPAL